jgi:phosphopantetheine--protein transferase-like protein
MNKPPYMHIGVDSIDINRFALWHTYSNLQLKKIFTSDEIHYARSVSYKTAERLAVRFCAKEAVYKSLFPYMDKKQTFLSSARYIHVSKTPSLHAIVQWDHFGISEHLLHISLSLTHSKTIATAVALIHRNA